MSSIGGQLVENHMGRYSVYFAPLEPTSIGSIQTDPVIFLAVLNRVGNNVAAGY